MAQVQVANYVFSTAQVLGKGSTGTVYLGVDIRNGMKVAVKVIELKTITNEVTRYLLQNEVKALQLTNHPNVLHAYDVVADSNCCYVITNYCPNSTLEDYIRKRGRIPEDEALTIFRQIVQGYASLSTRNILHRDLKPSNVLFSESYQPVICDFGYCEISGFLPKPKMHYNVGSPAYMAPESITGNMYSEGSEVWSLGTIYFEMLQGRSFADGKEVMHAIMEIKRKGPYAPDGASEFSKEIVRKCMALRPADRIRVKDLLIMLSGKPKARHPRPNQNLQMTQSIEFVAPKNQKAILTSNATRVPTGSNQIQQNQLPPQPNNLQRANSAYHQMQPELMNLQQQQLLLLQQQQQQLPPPILQQQSPLNVSQPIIQLGNSVHEERPPSSPGKPSFRPVSNRLGIDQHNPGNVNGQIPNNKEQTSIISKPEDFPQYMPEQSSHLKPHSSQNIQQSTTSIPSEMRNMYIQSNLQNIKQAPTGSARTSQLVQNYPLGGIKSNQNQLQAPPAMLSSKRSIGSSYSQNQILNSFAFMNPTGGTFATTPMVTQQGYQNPFLKTANSKKSVPHTNPQDSRNLQQLQMIQPSAMLKNLSKNKNQQPPMMQSGQRNPKARGNQSPFQTQIIFANSNYNAPHPYYPQSNLNFYRTPGAVGDRLY